MDIKSKFEAEVSSCTHSKDMVQFFKDLNNEERKVLVPLIKKLNKYYTEFIKVSDKGYGSWSSRGNVEQIGALIYAGYFCMNQKDFTKTFWGFRDETFYSVDFHDIYSPTWFSDYVNNADSNPSLNYQLLLDLYKAGYLQPSKALILRHLPTTIFKRGVKDKRNQFQYEIDSLYLHPITLKEHIWYLFSEESNINWSDRWIHIEGEKESSWKGTFATLIEKGDLDRIQVLKECLKCSTRNYNKILTGWYFDLLTFLEPSNDELFSIQEDLFSVFNCQHSKPINVCLKYIKSICTNAKFNQEYFLESIPVLLASEVKTTVNSSLMILDKIAKVNKDLQGQICELTVDAFLHKDEKIQIRAAKLLDKHGDKESEELSQNIGMYQTELFSSVKEILSSFNFGKSEAEDSLDENLEYEKLVRIKGENEIQKIESLEEMIFFFAQVFENNEAYHFDLFLELLPRLYQMIDETNFSQLEPAYLRASKTVNAWNQKIGSIENYMAITFCNVMSLLIKKYPNEKKINKLQEAVLDIKVYVKRVKDENIYASIMSLIENKKTGASYIPFTSRLAFVRKMCEQNIIFPLLATPTHSPCWITLENLVNKLKIYQEQKEAINLYDFQIAINRLVFEKGKAHEEIIQSNLQYEFKDLLLYLISDKKLDIRICLNPSLWLAAVYRKGNQEDLKQFLNYFDKDGLSSFMLDKPRWTYESEQVKRTVWNYQKKKNEKKIVEYKYLRIKEEKPEKKISKIILDKLSPKKDKLNSIYHCFKETGSHSYIQSNDDKKMLFLSPFNPDLILRLNIIKSLQQINWTDAEVERVLTSFTEGLIHIWDDFGELTYLQLACTLLYIKKPNRQLAAELWIQAVSQKKMNHELLGKCIGRLEFNEYGPLKRFTDLINDQMMNISKEHNQALETLIIHLLMQLNEKPIKGTSKLLELYGELLQRNESEISADLKSKLATWTSSKALAKTIKSLA